MKRNLFIHAVNVHQGGGRTLLASLLEACGAYQQVIALLDSRMVLPNVLPRGLTIRRVNPSILERLRAEWWLARHVKAGDGVLCFGNLPPLFGLRGHTSVFVQNRLLIDGTKLEDFKLRTRFRLRVERLWFASRTRHIDEFIVQTPSMKRLLSSTGLVDKQPVNVRPFMRVEQGELHLSATATGDQKIDKKYDFIYVASSEPHKNHRRLIEAWCILAEQGLFPKLCLTMDRNSSAEFCDWMEERQRRYGLKLENVGNITREQVMNHYMLAKALIYPSLLESFGLPLLEAHRLGLPVLAPELDYVRDILDPEQTFDPLSPVSIAKAVKRFMGVREPPMQIDDATQFMAAFAGKAD